MLIFPGWVCGRDCPTTCACLYNAHKGWQPQEQAKEGLVSKKSWNKGLINASRVFVVGTLNILHDHLYCHFVASFRLLQSPCHVLQCSTHYLRAVKDPKTSKTSRLSTRSFRQRFVADANVYRQQIRVCVALIDAIKSVFIPNYHLLRIGVVTC